jgi:hypothetical protein
MFTHNSNSLAKGEARELLFTLYSFVTALPSQADLGQQLESDTAEIIFLDKDCSKAQRKGFDQMVARLPISPLLTMLPPWRGRPCYGLLVGLIPRLRSAIKVSIGLIEILIDHDPHIFEKCGLESVVSCLHSLVVKVNDYQQYIDTLKFSLEWMHARSLRQTLPNMPKSIEIRSEGNNCLSEGSSPLLFSGAMRRWLRNRLVSLSDKNQHLFWSFAQAKRCADVVPDDFVQKSLLKHRDAMSRPSSQVEPEFLDLLKEKFIQIIKGLEFKSIDDVHSYTSSACWESSAKNGGGKLELLYEFVSKGYTSNDELLKMSYHPRSGVSEMRGFVTMDLQEMIRECPLSPCRAKVHPICEPLKIRNITKSNALPYAIAKGFQLDMHTHLKNKFQFQLIGKTIETDMIRELVRRSPDGIFASGDFSAATDNVNIDLTKLYHELCIAYLDFVRPDVSSEYIQILRNVLFEHEIHYPPLSGLEPVVQQNGQLMGSVLSFPVLCAINLAVYWISVEPEVKDIRKLNVLINGDDILFRTTKDKYQIWLTNVVKAGLHPSPGKNFFHPKYCTVNSEMYSVHGDTVTNIPFFNAGMLLGQSKVARSDGKSKPVHCIYQDAISGAFNKARASDRFLYYNKEKLQKCSRTPDGVQLNYFISRELGGLGMKLPNMSYISADRYVKMSTSDKSAMYPYTIVTGAQRKIARYLLEKWQKPYLKAPCKPIGYELDPEREDVQFHQLPNDDYHILIPRSCPQLPNLREKKRDYNPSNWCCEPTDSFELERMVYQFKGIRRYRSAKLTAPNHLLHEEWTEYKWIGEHDCSPKDETIDYSIDHFEDLCTDDIRAELDYRRELWYESS